MLPSDREWLESYLSACKERRRTANELTSEMLRRSREQIAMSKNLLKIAVPRVWRFTQRNDWNERQSAT